MSTCGYRGTVADRNLESNVGREQLESEIMVFRAAREPVLERPFARAPWVASTPN